MNKQDVKPVSSNNSFVYQVETSNAKDPNITAAIKGEPNRPVTHLKKYTSEVERLKAVSKSQNEKLAKKKVVKEEKLLPLPSAMTRPGKSTVVSNFSHGSFFPTASLLPK